MANASDLFREKAQLMGIEIEDRFELIHIVTYFQNIIYYFYAHFGIKYSEIITWKIGTFLWHVSLMIREVQERNHD